MTIWLSPTSYSDPDSAWITETNAYDDDTGTYAGSSGTIYGPNHYLELNRGGAELSCGSCRIYANTGANDPDINIDFRYDGAWHNIFSGTITKNTWVIKVNSAGIKLVTKARIKWNVNGVGQFAYLYEFDFGGGLRQLADFTGRNINDFTGRDLSDDNDEFRVLV